MTPDRLRELRRLADRAEGAAIALREALDEAVNDAEVQCVGWDLARDASVHGIAAVRVRPDGTRQTVPLSKFLDLSPAHDGPAPYGPAPSAIFAPSWLFWPR